MHTSLQWPQFWPWHRHTSLLCKHKQDFQDHSNLSSVSHSSCTYLHLTLSFFPIFPYLSTFLSTYPCLLSSCFLFFLNSVSYCVSRTSTLSHPLSHHPISTLSPISSFHLTLSFASPFLLLLIIPSPQTHSFLFLLIPTIFPLTTYLNLVCLYAFLFDFLVCTHTHTHAWVSISNTELPQNI